jgi:hypothetical protein
MWVKKAFTLAVCMVPAVFTSLFANKDTLDQLMWQLSTIEPMIQRLENFDYTKQTEFDATKLLLAIDFRLDTLNSFTCFLLQNSNTLNYDEYNSFSQKEDLLNQKFKPASIAVKKKIYYSKVQPITSLWDKELIQTLAQFITVKVLDGETLSLTIPQEKITSNQNKQKMVTALQATLGAPQFFTKITPLLQHERNRDLFLFSECNCVNDLRKEFENNVLDHVKKFSDPITYLSIASDQLLSDLRILVSMVTAGKKIGIVHIVDPGYIRSLQIMTNNLNKDNVMNASLLKAKNDNDDFGTLETLLRFAQFLYLLSSVQGTPIQLIIHPDTYSYIELCKKNEAYKAHVATIVDLKVENNKPCMYAISRKNKPYTLDENDKKFLALSQNNTEIHVTPFFNNTDIDQDNFVNVCHLAQIIARYGLKPNLGTESVFRLYHESQCVRDLSYPQLLAHALEENETEVIQELQKMGIEPITKPEESEPEANKEY